MVSKNALLTLKIKGHSGKWVVDKVATTGKARSHTFIRALPMSRNVPFKDVINLEVAGAKFAPATSNCFSKDDRFLCFEMDSIPVSGYTTFQERDFSLLAKAQADHLSVQSTMTWQGSLSKGPFPLYEEIPLIKMLVMSSKAKYCDDYMPIAHTNTNIPLTVSR